jgi:O-methyltransferase
MILDKLKSFIYKKYLKRYDYGMEAIAAISLVKKHTMSTPIDLATLYEVVVHLDRHSVEGDFVECGVWKGGCAGMMAIANLKHSNSRRNIHLFDLFDDIVAPNPGVDGGQAMSEFEAHLKSTKQKQSEYLHTLKPVKGIYDSHGGAGSVGAVNNLLIDRIQYPADRLCYHIGLFQETVPASAIDKISLLRLDGDWYDSIKVCLEGLYDKVVLGGVIIIDDYSTYDGCKKAVDEFFASKELKYFKHYSRPQTRYFFKYS